MVPLSVAHKYKNMWSSTGGTIGGELRCMADSETTNEHEYVCSNTQEVYCRMNNIWLHIHDKNSHAMYPTCMAEWSLDANCTDACRVIPLDRLRSETDTDDGSVQGVEHGNLPHNAAVSWGRFEDSCEANRSCLERRDHGEPFTLKRK